MNTYWSDITIKVTAETKDEAEDIIGAFVKRGETSSPENLVVKGVEVEMDIHGGRH